MSEIYVSDEYRWRASGELFWSVLGFLRDAVKEPGARGEIEAVLDYQLPTLDVRALSGAGRAEVWRCLSTRLAAWAERELEPVPPEGGRRPAVGHVKTLALMARDTAETQGLAEQW